MYKQSVQYLGDFLNNPVFLTSVTAFVVAQVIKTIVRICINRGRNVKEILITLFWNTGGIPSSHSALVSAMAASTALNEGISSNIFIVTMFFALIVIRDSLGVRRAAGLQARALNTLGRKISASMDFKWHPVKEIQGHKPVEVTLGVIIGILCVAVFKIFA